MIPISLAEIAAATGGRVEPVGAGSVVVSADASVDSRSIQPGALFVAVVGANSDGHDFARAAGDNGAAAVLGERSTALPTVVVTDVVEALGALARHVVALVPGLRVHALTGSQGKTGTKDYLAAILSAAGETVATTGNLNNELGVPLTALRVEPSTRFLVLEMGARGVGHIAYLAGLVRPDVAAVINVGTAHLGEFGSRERIAQAKGELVEALSPEGWAVLNADDPMTAAMVSRTSAHTLTFGETGEVSWRDLRLDEQGRPHIELRLGDAWYPLGLSQLGAHQVPNAAAAAAMAWVEGCSPELIVTALAHATPASRWRMERRERADGLVVINDAYNANPASMAAALAALRSVGASTGRRTVAVLGEMRELGAESHDAHRRLGELVANDGIDVLVCVGAAADPIAAGAAAAGAGLTVVRTDGRDEATAWVRHNVSAGDVVLVKASRGVALEQLVEALMSAEPIEGGVTT